MKDIIGIIGAGNMGGAIGHALAGANFDIAISNRSKEKLEQFKKYENARLFTDNKSLVKYSKYIIIAVKPNMYKKIIDEIKEEIDGEKVIISIAAGFTIGLLEEMLPDRKIAMTMPNTPALVGEGMSAICPNSLMIDDEKDYVLQIFNAFGKASIIEESQFPAFAGACGCLPAYVYMFIEAVSDAAVLNGMKRSYAYEFISQTILGSAKMVLETKRHPGDLKDMVTSPGGTTIEGVKILEENAFRGSVIDAVDAAIKKGIR